MDVKLINISQQCEKVPVKEGKEGLMTVISMMYKERANPFPFKALLDISASREPQQS